MSDEVKKPDGPVSDRDQASLDAAAGMVDMSKLGQQDTKAPPAPVPEVQKETAGQPVVQPSIEIKTPLGTKKFGDTGGPVLSSFADVQTYAKEQGFELKSPDDIRQLISTVNDLKTKAEAVPKLESALNSYKSQIGGLPPEIFNLIEVAASGKDYKSVLKDLAAGVSIDFTKPYSDHNSLNLIRQYVQPNLTQDQFDELTDINKDTMHNLAKVKYEGDKIKWEQATRDRTVEKEAYTQKYSQSMEVALTNLKREFPDLSQEAIKVVADRMAYGVKESLFNEDNTYRPDAGVKIAMQEFGKEALSTAYQTFGDYVKQIRSQIQGTVNEQILIRSDAPDLQGRRVADNTNVIAETVKRETNFLHAK